MNIIQNSPEKKFDLRIILSWQDFERLDQGNEIGDRYNGQDKVIIHRTYPIINNSIESRLESLKQREYAIWNRETMDVDIFIPHGVLRDCRIFASNFNQGLGNLKINPWMLGEPYASAHIKIEYPISLKIIDLTPYYED